jgi:hypothetical protein
MCSIRLVSAFVLEITPNMKVPTEVTGMRLGAEEAFAIILITDNGESPYLFGFRRYLKLLVYEALRRGVILIPPLLGNTSSSGLIH